MRLLKVVVVAAMANLCAIPSGCASEFDWWRAAVAGYKALQAYTLSDNDVIQYVKQSVDYMDRSNNKLPASSPYTRRLKNLTSGLRSVDGVPLNFEVYRVDNEVNAFACADGSVRVYTSLMDLMTDDELLGVIGHEIGHVGKHHTRKAIKAELLSDAFRQAIASSDSRLAMLADSQLGDIGLMMMNAKYSRSQEQEADDYGYDFLKQSGKDPYNMVKALEKLKSLEGKSNKVANFVSKMFSSHPETDKRISRLKERYQKDATRR